jgi:hypothetical protein
VCAASSAIKVLVTRVLFEESIFSLSSHRKSPFVFVLVLANNERIQRVICRSSLDSLAQEKFEKNPKSQNITQNLIDLLPPQPPR